LIRVRSIPIYWGIETKPVDRSLWCYSVLHETQPPYRHSTYGVRLRITPRHWLHLGTFLYDRNPDYFSLRIDPTDIGRWGKGAIPQENGDRGADPNEPVRPLER
jgi:hypothetical protein